MSTTGTDSNLLAEVERAYALVPSRPLEARSSALAVIERARGRRDREAEAAALHVVAYAGYVTGRPDAIACARAGIRVAERAGLRGRAGLIRRMLATQLAWVGHHRAGLRELERSMGELDAAERARSALHLLLVHYYRGPVDDAETRGALVSADSALRTLRRRGDLIWEARVLYNRGILLLALGDPGRAERDLARARTLYLELGARVAATDVTGALAEAAVLRDDLVEALDRISEVEAMLLPDETSVGVLFQKARALSTARLHREAFSATRELVNAVRAMGPSVATSHALLDAAAAALVGGDAATAGDLATRAARSFAGRGQRAHAARARIVRVSARLADGTVGPADVREMRRASGVLLEAGWRHDSFRAQIVAANAALARGGVRSAARSLASIPRGASTTVSQRIALLEADCRLAVARGERVEAMRLARTGLAVLRKHQATLGSIEARAALSELGAGLSALGLTVALSTGSAARLLIWSETVRASSLGLGGGLGADVPLRDSPALRELRTVTARRRLAEQRNRPDTRLLARQIELEHRVARESYRSRVRKASSDGGVELRSLRSRLRSTTLVEYVEVDDTLTAVVLAGGRLRLVPIGSSLDARREATMLGLWSARSRATRKSPGERLDELLLRRCVVSGPGAVLIVPSVSVHGIPWASLPTLRGRSVTLAPSARLWSELRARSVGRTSRIVAVQGPRLSHARHEIASIAGIHRGVQVLRHRDATSGIVLAAIDGARIAHLACHGHFRADAPLFSSLELHDGPLNVYDLQQLGRPPELVVLSACDLGLSEVRPGDELLGMATALLAMGTRTVVASVIPVPDRVARAVMVRFHAHLAGGSPPAESLALAQAALPARDRPFAGFVCIGAG